MTLNDLINRINHLYGHKGNLPIYIKDAVIVLQQQAQEIEQLKENLHNKIISSARRILILEEKLEDCTCQGGHSEAYLKAKGKL